MSLKAFHILFVIVTTLASLGISALGWYRYFHDVRGGEWSDGALGIGGMVSAALLWIYGNYFMRKLRHISYL